MLQRHPLGKLAAIYVGGVIGALFRVGLGEAFPHAADAWPWPTFAANLLGAFLIGYVFAALSEQSPDRLHHPFLATGFCGALTTFSAMQLELFNMVDAGETGLAVAYLGATLVFGYLAVKLGFVLEASRPKVRS